jgi:hypothetical protein
MTVWSVVILNFFVFSFLCGSYPFFFLHIFLYFTIFIPFYTSSLLSLCTLYLYIYHSWCPHQCPHFLLVIMVLCVLNFVNSVCVSLIYCSRLCILQPLLSHSLHHASEMLYLPLSFNNTPSLYLTYFRIIHLIRFLLQWNVKFLLHNIIQCIITKWQIH